MTHDKAPPGWLDIEPSRDPWFDPPIVPPKPSRPPALQDETVASDTSRRDMVAALQAVSAHQRVFMQELIDAQFDVTAAIRNTKRRGFPMNRRLFDINWSNDPAFMKALAQVTEYKSLTIGVSKIALMLKLDRLIEDTRALRTYQDREGNTRTEPVNATAARHAIETAAKLGGLLREERHDDMRRGPGLTIILNNAPANVEVKHTDAINGEFLNITPGKR